MVLSNGLKTTVLRDADGSRQNGRHVFARLLCHSTEEFSVFVRDNFLAVQIVEEINCTLLASSSMKDTSFFFFYVFLKYLNEFSPYKGF
jgi:hypothetical protein